MRKKRKNKLRKMNWDRVIEDCCDKRTYETKGAAKFFGSIYNQIVYVCPKCEKYHLTSQRQKNR